MITATMTAAATGQLIMVTTLWLGSLKTNHLMLVELDFASLVLFLWHLL